MNVRNLCPTVAFLTVAAACGQAMAACVPPVGFQDPSPPEAQPVEQLVSHTEEILIRRPLAVVYPAVVELPLEDHIYRGMSLPKVTGMYTLPSKTAGRDNSPGLPSSRTLVCFSDGSTVLEEPIIVNLTDKDFRYFYQVWNYTSDAFRAVDYAVADLRYSETPGGNTIVSWTYSFKPNGRKYAEYSGQAGEQKFRDDFLEGPFAEMLRGSLEIWKVRAEAEPAALK